MTFKTATIGDIASVQTGPFGSQLHNKDYVLIGTPIVTVEHLGQRKMARQNLPCVSDADRQRLSKYTLEYGDLVFSRVGSVDRCSWVSEEEDGWLFSGRCLRVRPHNPEEVYHKYLYYFFSLESTKNFVRNIAVGATMPSINTRLLSEVPISYPSIEEQRQIGDTLSALDDRIEANSRINLHLEQMAQTIFKSWFVDFEPFGGEMPGDWWEGTLNDVCAYNTERIGVSNLTLDPYISTENMSPDKGGFVRAASLPTISQTTAFAIGDTLISNIRPYFKKIVFCGFIGGCSTDVLCFRPNKANLSHYVYNLLYNDSFFDFMVAGSKGTKMPRGDKQQIMNYHTVIPSANALDNFNTIVAPLIRKRLLLVEESSCLSELRDTLLPRLISGELRVVDIRP